MCPPALKTQEICRCLELHETNPRELSKECGSRVYFIDKKPRSINISYKLTSSFKSDVESARLSLLLCRISSSQEKKRLSLKIRGCVLGRKLYLRNGWPIRMAS